jgi:SPP1 gp7 family putative phage head morphogenesis protein
MRADPNIAKNPPRSLGPIAALERAAVEYARRLIYHAFVAALPDVFGGGDSAASDDEAERYVADFADVVAKAALIEDVTGRQSLIRDLPDAVKGRARKVEFGGFTVAESEFVTIPFLDAAADVLSKTALPADSIDDVLDAYDRHQFTIQANVAQDVLELVQIKIANLVAGGGTPADFVKFAAGLLDGEVSDAYARTVFRTERTGAFAAGRLAQAFGDDLDDFVVAFKYVAVGDGDTRPNHKANDGKYFDKRDPNWAGRIPPNGFNCRCRLLAIDKLRAERMGRWDAANRRFVSDAPPPDGEPDPGFGNSPLLAIYGATQ